MAYTKIKSCTRTYILVYLDPNIYCIDINLPRDKFNNIANCVSNKFLGSFV